MKLDKSGGVEGRKQRQEDAVLVYGEHTIHFPFIDIDKLCYFGGFGFERRCCVIIVSPSCCFAFIVQ